MIALLLALNLFAQDPIEFSDNVLTYERLSAFAWRAFSLDFEEIYTKRGYRAEPSGEVTFLRWNGTPLLRMSFGSVCREVGEEDPETHCETFMQFVDFKGRTHFKIEIHSEGSSEEGIEPVSLEDLREGRFPFFPDDEWIRHHVIKIWISGDLAFEIRLVRSEDAMDVNFSAPWSGDFLRYREIWKQGSREVIYDLRDERVFGDELQLKARRIQLPEMLVGTEEYYRNGVEIDLKEYRQLFEENFLYYWVIPKWQASFETMVDAGFYIF